MIPEFDHWIINAAAVVTAIVVIGTAAWKYLISPIYNLGVGDKLDDLADKIAASAERTLVIAMIETPEGVANVDAIAAVDGVDVLWLGHFDLTNFMGIAGEFEHPDYLAAVDRIVAAARRHGKTAAVMSGDDAWARRYHGLGFRMFACGLDVQLFQRGLAAGIGAVRALG